jgi:hypothetical protein
VTMKKLFLATMIAAGVGLAQSGSASVLDPMDNTSNFDAPFGGEGVTANGDGTVTLTRTVANQDAGVDWVGPAGHLSISDEPLLTITPVGPVSGGYYNANILLFNSSGGYLAEKQWLGDNNSSAAQTVNVAQFASDLGVSGAAQYWVRFRVDPFGQAGAGFTFTEMDAVAVPEPTSGLLFLGALPLLWAARKANRS